MKIVESEPKHPLSVASPGYPPTPKSPEEYRNVCPWSPSFMYLSQCKYLIAHYTIRLHTHCIVSSGSIQEDLFLPRRRMLRLHLWACRHHTLVSLYIHLLQNLDRWGQEQDHCQFRHKLSMCSMTEKIVSNTS